MLKRAVLGLCAALLLFCGAAHAQSETTPATFTYGVSDLTGYSSAAAACTAFSQKNIFGSGTVTGTSIGGTTQNPTCLVHRPPNTDYSIGISRVGSCPPDGGWTLNAAQGICTRTKPTCTAGASAGSPNFYSGWWNAATSEYKPASGTGWATTCDGKCERSVDWNAVNPNAEFHYDPTATGWTPAYAPYPARLTGNTCQSPTNGKDAIGSKPTDTPTDPETPGEGEDDDEPTKCKADETASYSGGTLVCTPKPKPPASEPGSGGGEGGEGESDGVQGNCPNGYHQATQNGRNVCVINQSPNPGSGSSGPASGPSSGASDAGTGHQY